MSDLKEITETVIKINNERTAVIRQIELMLHKSESESEIEELEALVEKLGGYVTRPWGSDDLIVKLTVGE